MLNAKTAIYSKNISTITLGVIHKGRPHRRGEGGGKPKCGQGGWGISVQADVRILHNM